MSQTAAMRTLGIVASDFMRVRQRPPVPMQPTLSVSLGEREASTAGAPIAVSAAAVADVFRNERRDTSLERDMEVGSGGHGGIGAAILPRASRGCQSCAGAVSSAE